MNWDCWWYIRNNKSVSKRRKFGLSSQLSRYSISIPSNIAEGSARTDKSFSHFIDIALGSSFELETQLIIAFKRKYIYEEQLNKLEEKITEFQKMTMGFKTNSNRSYLFILSSLLYKTLWVKKK